MNHERWTPYYTSQKVALEILKHVPKGFTPEIVVDICAGSGNFLASASNEAWTKTKYYAFDVVLNESLKSNPDWTLTKLNSLLLPKLISNVPFDKRKLVLANPPFGAFHPAVRYNKSHKHLEILFQEANKTHRMEAKMLLANLSIMRTGDIFAAILPENVFCSETFSGFKKEFLSHFSILKLGNPKQYFEGCEVRTRMFVGIYSETQIKKKASKTMIIPSTFQIVRGIDNSKLLDNTSKRKNLKEVLHFNTFYGAQTNRRFVKFESSFSNKVLERNDLLIIRVGRNAGRIFSAKPSLIGKLYSDHFFVVKNVEASRAEREVIEIKLRKSIKGLTTNYLNKTDIERALIGVAA